MAEPNGSKNGGARAQGQGPRRDHRRRQLRQLAPPGRRVLQGTRSRTTVRPRAHARRTSAATTSRDIEFTRGVRRRRRARSARTSPTRSGRTRTTRSSSPTCRRRASRSRRGMTHDGIGKYLSQVVEKAPGETDDVVEILKETQDRRRRQLPPCRLRGGDEVVRGADPRGRLRDGELHAACSSRARPYWQQPLRAGRRADHRRRHQVAGRRDDHAPRADVASSASAACTSTRRCS